MRPAAMASVQALALRRLRTRAQPNNKSISLPYFDAERFTRMLQNEGFSSAQAPNHRPCAGQCRE